LEGVTLCWWSLIAVPYGIMIHPKVEMPQLEI
jgi:hypothetical protein